MVAVERVRIVERIRTHYELLGVAPDAPTAAVRDAYRRAARVHHPDAQRSSGDDTMAALNEAWRVLGDPVRRARYDAELAGRRPAPGAPPPVAERPSVVAEARPTPRYPWRLVLGLAAFGVAIVIIGVIAYRPSEPAPPDNILGAGSCVVIERNGDAREVNCTDAHDGVVSVLVPFGANCPDRTEPHRDRQGLGIACVRGAAAAAMP